MAKTRLEPYIFFKGNCREAMEFYKNTFGGELNTQTYQETGQSMEGTEPDWIMHARLESEDVALMGSDTAKASDVAAKVSLSLTGDDENRLRQIFDGLSEGGNVFSALKKEFWGDTFGSVTDKYGVDWMVNITAASGDA